MNTKIQKAKSLLVHYFQLTAEEAGLTLNWDCIGEIEDIIDLLVAGIHEETQSTPPDEIAQQEAPKAHQHNIVAVQRVCRMSDMVEVGEPWYELLVNGETVARFETLPQSTSSTPVHPYPDLTCPECGASPGPGATGDCPRCGM